MSDSTYSTKTRVGEFMTELQHRNPGETEFHQAVREFAETVIPFIEQHPHYEDHNLMRRLTEPDRVISFKVTWVDDQNRIQVNRGYRVQFNNAIGPYKGGLRFHPSVNRSILKFLGFEQIFKNSLTCLPMGGGKGGSDFDPKGKSDGEVMRFCQAFMTELHKYIGPDIDVPAGDIGVGGREIGFLFGEYKKITHRHAGVLTGKGLSYGGSLIRPEATGYGCVYFLEDMLKKAGHGIAGKHALISGAGNVAQYAAEKLLDLGAKVLTMSDSGGFIYDKEGIDREKLEWIMDLKNNRRGRIKEYAEKFNAIYVEGKRPWQVEGDLALPCATQNELLSEDAQQLINNGCLAVAEGANMPTSDDAVDILKKNDVLFAPGKAANAGGVATSGLEMSQNAMHTSWTREEVDKRLRTIMTTIHNLCVQYGEKESGNVDYVKGANIAGFVKVADSLMAQGV
ncbi:MAG TPA: NADP-specific glutamate dehydrogenase [Saprospiraceae bacterium]|nr:NADP-specific glutamate dehydrogenase [Saprospiraceae bacterium]